MNHELWAVWEIMGATDGATRGAIKKRLETTDARGWELVLNLAIVGSDGHWPGNTAIWKLPGPDALARRLDAGLDDGFDETGVSWGRAMLCRRVSGSLNPAHRAFLVEYVVAESRPALEALQGPDLLLADLMSPWQGVCVWGAADMHAIARRDREGLGVSGQAGVLQATGAYNVIPVEREMV